MPAWANNPDYTLHATSTKPDESHHKPVFEIFDDTKKDHTNNKAKDDNGKKKSISTVSNRVQQNSSGSEPTTRL